MPSERLSPALLPRYCSPALSDVSAESTQPANHENINEEHTAVPQSLHWAAPGQK